MSDPDREFPDKLHDFDSPAIRVTWSKTRCIHAAECVRGLPRVFQPGSRPWVKPGAGEAARIAEVVERCPTGALHHQRLDGGPAEVASERNFVTPEPNGPLFVRGQAEIVDGEGRTVLRDTRMALCRCGASSAKPLCDGSHARVGFADRGEVFEGGVEPGEISGPVLRFTVTPHGPLVAQGPLVVRSADQLMRLTGGKAKLCRCGASRNKPFCDGSHRHVEFEGA